MAGSCWPSFLCADFWLTLKFGWNTPDFGANTPDFPQNTPDFEQNTPESTQTHSHKPPVFRTSFNGRKPVSSMALQAEKCYNKRMKGGHDLDEISESGIP